MHRIGLRGIPFLLIAVLVLLAPGLAQEHPLTNADVVKMLDAGIPESVVVRKIQVSETSFLTTPDALIGLKQQRVPAGVLAAMVESQAPVRGVVIGPGDVQFAGGTSAGKPLHQLPNIDASFRIDSKTSGKVQVRKNQIKIEKAGVPLFSVKWKLNTAK